MPRARLVASEGKAPLAGKMAACVSEGRRRCGWWARNMSLPMCALSTTIRWVIAYISFECSAFSMDELDGWVRCVALGPLNTRLKMLQKNPPADTPKYD